MDCCLCRFLGHRLVMCLAAVGVAACCALIWRYQDLKAEHGSIALISVGSLGEDSRILSGLGNEVQDDLLTNTRLQKSLGKEFNTHANCHCDCTQSPELKVKAATMLDQVGEVSASPTSLPAESGH